MYYFKVKYFIRFIEVCKWIFFLFGIYDFIYGYFYCINLLIFMVLWDVNLYF